LTFLCNFTIAKLFIKQRCAYVTVIILSSLRLSFAVAARQMKDKARVVAMDLRGHGKSTTSDDLDLSIDVCNLFVIIDCYSLILTS